MSKFFDVLKQAAADSWHEYVDHDFVRSLSGGTLAESHFLHYLKQDYIFLVHFSRAWSLLAFKTDDIEEIRFASGMVHALINEEMRLHIEFCDRNGISKSQLDNVVETMDNLAYTRYVIGVGIAGDFLDMLTALAPCVLGYGEIGMGILGSHDGDVENHPYGEWIAAYSGGPYQELCAKFRRFLDAAAVKRIGKDFASSPRLSGLVGIFETACKLESKFWEIGLSGGN